MRDDEIRSLLRDQNPWWRTVGTGDDPTGWRKTNRTLNERSKFDLGYRPGVLDDVKSNPGDGNLVILTGPRRIGKSVALMDAAVGILANGIDPRRLIYVTCEQLSTSDFRRVLITGRSLTSSIDVGVRSPRIWLIDEIGYVKGWSAVLKTARDQTEFGNDTVVVTSSRWQPNEDVQGNLLAGRSGTGSHRRVRQLLPMTFADFLRVTTKELPAIQSVHPAELQSDAARREIGKAEFLINDFDQRWQDFMTCGGFPRAVFEHRSLGHVTPAYVNDLIAWLRDDVDPDARQDSVPLLISGVESRMAGPINISKLAQDLGYPTRYALETRVTRLVNSHALIRCHSRDIAGAVRRGSVNKLYFTDPIISWLPNLSTGLPEPDITRQTEAALGVAQARAIENLDEGRWISDDTVGYLRLPSGNEIDFAPVRIPTLSGTTLSTPIESKWVENKWRSEARTLEGKFSRGIMATKSILDLDRPSWAVPAPIVALLLE